MHLLSPFYPIFTWVDPYSEYGSGSTKLLNTDLIRIRIHTLLFTWFRFPLLPIFRLPEPPQEGDSQYCVPLPVPVLVLYTSTLIKLRFKIHPIPAVVHKLWKSHCGISRTPAPLDMYSRYGWVPIGGGLGFTSGLSCAWEPCKWTASRESVLTYYSTSAVDPNATYLDPDPSHFSQLHYQLWRKTVWQICFTIYYLKKNSFKIYTNNDTWRTFLIRIMNFVVFVQPFPPDPY